MTQVRPHSQLLLWKPKLSSPQPSFLAFLSSVSSVLGSVENLVLSSPRTQPGLWVLNLPAMQFADRRVQGPDFLHCQLLSYSVPCEATEVWGLKAYVPVSF